MDPILLTVLIHLGGKTKSNSSSKSIRLEALPLKVNLLDFLDALVRESNDTSLTSVTRALISIEEAPLRCTLCYQNKGMDMDDEAGDVPLLSTTPTNNTTTTTTTTD
jgi:hypothetical protein